MRSFPKLTIGTADVVAPPFFKASPDSATRYVARICNSSNKELFRWTVGFHSTWSHRSKKKKQECNVKWDIKTFHFWQQFVYHTGYFTPGTKISCRSLIQVWLGSYLFFLKVQPLAISRMNSLTPCWKFSNNALLRCFSSAILIAWWMQQIWRVKPLLCVAGVKYDHTAEVPAFLTRKS